MNRNQNILMAILSLMRELDQGSLEIVRRESEKLLRWFIKIFLMQAYKKVLLYKNW